MTRESQDIVARLGSGGDGVLDTPAGPQFIAGVVPGESVARDDAGGWARVGAPSPDRRLDPLCPHVGACGGCTVQHFSDDLYRQWKARLLPEALGRAGLEVKTAPLVRVPLRSRRRAVLTAKAVRGGSDAVVLGYHRLRSHDIEAVTACAVLAPSIVAALPILQRLVVPLLKPDQEARLTVVATPEGLDVNLEGVQRRSRAAEVKAPIATFLRPPIVRVSIDGDPIFMRAQPMLKVADISLPLPPGAFVQASAEAEQAMQLLAVDALRRARRVADLFCGLGTFAFALARKARVLAVDGDRALVDALAHGARSASGLKPIETKVRDLYRDPLSPRELAGFDAVLFDPPRAGAKAQAEAIAASQVKTAIAVSCNPTTLVRDLRILVDAGFHIDTVTPIDQFLFTPHLEAVAILRR